MSRDTSPPTAAPSNPRASASAARAALAAAELRRLERAEEAELYAPVTGAELEWHKEQLRIQFAAADAKRSTYERHRAAEHATAEFFERVMYPAFPHRRVRRRGDDGATREGRPEYLAIAERLRNCRLSGPFGVTSAGALMVAWDEKCGLVRLCPDEAQAESQRLREAYEPGLLALVRRGCSIHRGVLTLKNYPAGRLREGKRYIFKRFRDRILRARRDGAARFPIRGALVVQEDPLSARGDWNVHLNVILICDRFIDYGDLRAAWGANLEISRHPPNYSDSAMARLWAETIKYAVRTVPEKSAAKAGAGASSAPAFTEWPPELADEWWQAGKGFRRSRSYGELRAFPAEFRQAAAAIKSRSVHWLGRLDWRAGKYAITWRPALDSIRADNSPTPGARAGPWRGTGPPDPGGWQ